MREKDDRMVVEVCYNPDKDLHQRYLNKFAKLDSRKYDVQRTEDKKLISPSFEIRGKRMVGFAFGDLEYQIDCLIGRASSSAS